MMEKRILKGVPGILRPFKEFMEAQGVKPADQIVYYGVPGTCTPFIELLAFAVRGMDLEQVYVPYFEERKARLLQMNPDAGMQVSTGMPGSLRPRVVVVLGGLSMPNIPVTVDQAMRTLDAHPQASRVGVCFMHMFDQAGWREPLSFALVIDAMIDPVEVLG